MKNQFFKKLTALALASVVLVSAAGCGGSDVALNDGTMQEVDKESLQFPLAETATLTGLTSYPANTESDPNNRTIFKRLEEATNVHIDWTAIQSDQWGDKITLAMADTKTLTDFVFTAGFGDSDLLKYADQGIIIPLEGYIDEYMPNLKAVFDKYPEYRYKFFDWYIQNRLPAICKGFYDFDRLTNFEIDGYCRKNLFSVNPKENTSTVSYFFTKAIENKIIVEQKNSEIKKLTERLEELKKISNEIRRVHNKILSVIMPFLSFWEILLLCENYLCEHTFL